MPEKCPECGYAMRNLYLRTKTNNGKETWKQNGSKYCEECDVEKPKQSTKIIC